METNGANTHGDQWLGNTDNGDIEEQSDDEWDPGALSHYRQEEVNVCCLYEWRLPSKSGGVAVKDETQAAASHTSQICIVWVDIYFIKISVDITDHLDTLDKFGVWCWVSYL